MSKRLFMAILATFVVSIPVDAAEKTLRIVNNRAAFPIWNVYITPVGQTTWGKDQLGGTTIGAGQSYEWTIPWDSCLVNVKATTFTGLSAEKRSVDVCGGFTWTLYDTETKPVPSSVNTLRIVNNRVAFPIWNVYITPAGHPNWGKDQLGDTTIGAGQSHDWTIPWESCLVDVKATTFTGLSAEKRGLNVCGGSTWTLYDKH